MNKLQHLLIKLAEEASEVAQIALKTSQFGADEMMPGQPYTNFQRCHQELNDLLGVVDMLNLSYNFEYTPDIEQIKKKVSKVDKYRKYSIELGLVTNE